MTQKQCTESKTRFGALSAHLDPACTHCAHVGSITAVSWVVSQPVAGRVTDLAGRVAAYIVTHPAPRPCARAVSRVAACVAAPSAISWRLPAVSQHCIATQPVSTLLARYNRLYHDMLASQTARLSRYKDCIVTQPPSGQPLTSVTKQNFVSRHNPPARPRTHALLAVSWPPLTVSWPVPWPSRPYRGRPCESLRALTRLLCAQAHLPGPAYQALCHNTACCIVTHT